MKRLQLITTFIILACLSAVAQQNFLSTKKLTPLKITASQGVSGAVAGIDQDGNLVVAGGCNFPAKPAAKGGEKVFYNSIMTLKGDKWEESGKLPDNLAYAAQVQVPDGMIAIGGNNKSNSMTNSVLHITNHKVDKLPSLPTRLTNAAAAMHDGYIYVAGGETYRGPNHVVWKMKYPEAEKWDTVAEMPGKGRIQPCVVIQNGATQPMLYILGGYHPVQKGQYCTVHDDGMILNLKTLEWTKTSRMPVGVTCVGSVADAVGYSHIICFGGVNKVIFQNRLNEAVNGKVDSTYMNHDPSWYQFRQDALVYHTITDSWTTIGGSTLLGRAGASLVQQEGRWILVNGETKPGIRATSVTKIALRHNTSFGWINWTVLAIYLLGMLALGYYFMRRENGAEDFFKGGGRIPWWAAGISIYATMLSAITYMAIPAKAYATDWTYYPMLITILIVSFPVIKYYLPYFRKLNITTAYEYLEIRFNLPTRLLASALFIVFMIARMALVLYLPSLALTAVTGIDIRTCILLMSMVTIIYCTMGGVEAVVWGDVIQGVILVGGAIFAVVYLAMRTEGGVAGCIDIAMDNHKLQLFDWNMSWSSATWWVVIIGGMANNLISYTSDQTVIQRYLTTKDEKSAAHSILLNGVMSAFISVAFYAIGTGLYTFFKTHPGELDFTMAKGDAILPYFMMSQMPAGVAGLLIAAIFAATMSTISSNINSVATAFSVDFYQRFLPKSSNRRILNVARTACIISGLIGMSIALMMTTWNILSLLDYFNTILGLLSSGLGGLFLMGVFCKRVQGWDALAGFVVGTIAVFAMQAYTDANFLLYGAFGMLVSVMVGLAASFTHGKTTTN